MQQEPFCCNPRCSNHKYLTYPHQMDMYLSQTMKVPDYLGTLPLSEQKIAPMKVTHITMRRYRFERSVSGVLISGVFCEVCAEALTMMSFDGEMEFPE